MCHISRVTYHMLRVTCHFFLIVVELVCLASVINGSYSVQFHYNDCGVNIVFVEAFTFYSLLGNFFKLFFLLRCKLCFKLQRPLFSPSSSCQGKQAGCACECGRGGGGHTFVFWCWNMFFVIHLNIDLFVLQMSIFYKIPIIWFSVRLETSLVCPSTYKKHIPGLTNRQC